MPAFQIPAPPPGPLIEMGLRYNELQKTYQDMGVERSRIDAERKEVGSQIAVEMFRLELRTIECGEYRFIPHQDRAGVHRVRIDQQPGGRR